MLWGPEADGMGGNREDRCRTWLSKEREQEVITNSITGLRKHSCCFVCRDVLVCLFLRMKETVCVEAESRESLS